jgi:coatomer protein complex subunit gamma
VPLQKEASEVFFAATKLFQSKDPHLRRMVYLCIKDICPGSDEVIIVTSSLMKDMNSKVELYRANAVRVLCQIVDSQLLAQIERYLKQAVVDKSAVVAAAVLCSAVHLMHSSGDIIKRWLEQVGWVEWGGVGCPPQQGTAAGASGNTAAAMQWWLHLEQAQEPRH